MALSMALSMAYYFLLVVLGCTIPLVVGNEGGHVQFKSQFAHMRNAIAREYNNWRTDQTEASKRLIGVRGCLLETADLCLKLSPKELLNQHHYDTSTPQTEGVDLENIPDSVDWRKKGVITPVKNQDGPNEDRSIAVVDCLVSFWAIKTGQLVNPSFEEFDDCCHNSPTLQCVGNIGGLALESDYPQNSNNTCMSGKITPTIIVKGSGHVKKGNETLLAGAVAKQPVVVMVDAGHVSFELYISGVYSSSQCSRERVDHAMLLVGYGTLNGEDYWLCQNSWGMID